MSTITRQEFSEYRLPQEVIVNFQAERQKSRYQFYVTRRGAPVSFSLSIQALNFAMIQRIDHVVDVIIAYYKQLNPNELNGTLTANYRLAPLHIAVMLKQLDLVKKLVLAGADVDVCDHHKWTPLHHAALGGTKEIIQFLCDHGANQKALTAEGGTYQDIFRMTQPLLHLNKSIRLLYQTTDGKVEQLTYATFKSLTNAEYLEENYVSRNWLIQKWRGPIQEEYSTTASYKNAYQTFLEHPPTHTIRDISQNENSSSLTSFRELGLFATTNHQSQEILGEYLAFIYSGDADDYTLAEDWHALKYRNETAFVNDGLPNARFVIITNSLGLPMRPLVVSVSPIQAGEQICLDYTSSHSVKVGSYIELRPLELRQFVNTCDLEEVKKSFQTFFSNFSPKFFSFDPLVINTQYIIETPTTLFNMVWDGSVEASKLKELINIFFNREILLSKKEVWENQIKFISLAERGYKIKQRLVNNQEGASLFIHTVNETLQKNGDISLILQLAQTLFPKMEQFLDSSEN